MNLDTGRRTGRYRVPLDALITALEAPHRPADHDR